MATKKKHQKPTPKKAAPKDIVPVKPGPVKKPLEKPHLKRSPAPAKPLAPLTTIIAQIDVGWGSSLYLRGEGGGLSWETGTLMDWVDGVWTWSTTAAPKGITYKFVLNDQVWAQGENVTVASGKISSSRPSF